MTLRKILFGLLMGSLFFWTSCSRDEDCCTNIEAPINLFATSARIVGYLPYYKFSVAEKIDYSKISHLNIAFANPSADGKFYLPESSNQYILRDIINNARALNNTLQIYISIAGGGLSQEQLAIWKSFIDHSDNRAILIRELVSYVEENEFDGVDVDLEWGAVTAGYSDFVLDLKQALNTINKGMTAALPGTTKYSQISSSALNAFDFINIMAYDFTGPWNPAAPGQHSSLDQAKLSVNYWKNTIGVPGEKLNLGVPFYGYSFQGDRVVSKSFGAIVAENSSYSEVDQVGNLYYNGRPTMAKKVKLAAQTLSGIMIWELGQDSFSKYSLLQTIYQSYTDFGVQIQSTQN